MRILLLFSFVAFAAATLTKFQFVEEWNMWKAEHGKSYGSEMEELERHLNWLSSKAYIEAHNANSHIFGFTLKMNHFGDMVISMMIKGESFGDMVISMMIMIRECMITS